MTIQCQSNPQRPQLLELYCCGYRYNFSTQIVLFDLPSLHFYYSSVPFPYKLVHSVLEEDDFPAKCDLEWTIRQINCCAAVLSALTSTSKTPSNCATEQGDARTSELSNRL